jgi:hypothetical protein
MTSHPPRKLAFVLAASDHGTIIVNRYDYHFVDQNRGFGVGLDILETAAFDRDGVDFAAGLLTLRRQYYGTESWRLIAAPISAYSPWNGRAQ